MQLFPDTHQISQIEIGTSWPVLKKLGIQRYKTIALIHPTHCGIFRGLNCYKKTLIIRYGWLQLIVL